MAPTAVSAATMAQRRSTEAALGAGCQCAFASRFIKDLLNAALRTDQAELHDDIHQLIQQGFDLRSRQIAAVAALFDEERQLFEGEFRARCVYARDRTWMSRIGIAQIIKRLVGAKFGE